MRLYLIIGGVVLATILGLVTYIHFLKASNASLNKDNMKLEIVVAASKNVIDALGKDKEISESILIQNRQARSDAERKNKQLQIQVEELLNASEDKCNNLPVDPSILDRM